MRRTRHFHFLVYIEKNIMGARPYKVRAQHKVTAEIRSAAAPERKGLRAIRNVCKLSYNYNLN